MKLEAPFHRFGGKKLAASLIWEALGNVPHLLLPFAGTCAELWARPTTPRLETINDLDGGVVNVLRAIKGDPDAVFYHCAGPVTETDLIARARWIVDHPILQAMRDDPELFDPKIAGWWLYAVNAWIGQGFGERRPGYRCLPTMTGQGRGVHAARFTREDMLALHARLAHRGMKILCRDWSEMLTNACMGFTTAGHSTGITPAGVVLDPPYPEGDDGLYVEGDKDIAATCRLWALERGDDPRIRIVLCGYEGQWTMPASWRCVSWTAHGGYGSQRKGGAPNLNRHRERLWLSPHCLGGDADPLFAARVTSSEAGTC